MIHPLPPPPPRETDDRERRASPPADSGEERAIDGLWSWIIPCSAVGITLAFACLPPDPATAPAGSLLFVDEFIKEVVLLVIGPLLLTAALWSWLARAAPRRPQGAIGWSFGLYLTGILCSLGNIQEWSWAVLNLLLVYLLPPGAFFWPMIRVSWSKASMARWAKIVVAGGWVVAMIGLGQYLEWSGWFLELPHLGPGSLLFNKNLAGEYVILVLPFAVAWAWLQRGWQRYAVGILAFVILEFLLATRARGAWTGLLGGTILVSAWLWWQSPKGASRLPWRRGGLLLSVALVVGTLLLPTPPRCESCAIPDRFLSIVRDGSPERLDFWQDALTMLPDHGWLGMGPGQFRRTFPGYMDRSHAHVRWDDASGEFGYPDRLHNDYLQLWLETGLPGGVGLLWLGGVILLRGTRSWTLARRRDEVERPAWLFAALVSFTSFAIVMLFSFPLQMPATAVHAWMVAGLLVALGNDAPAQPASSPPSLPGMGAAVVLGGGCFLISLIFAFRLLGADLQFGRALLAISRGDLASAQHRLDEALNLAPWWESVAVSKTRFELKTKQFRRVLATSEQILARHPHLGPVAWYRAIALVELRRLPEARKTLQIVRRQFPYITEAVSLAARVDQQRDATTTPR